MLVSHWPLDAEVLQSLPPVLHFRTYEWHQLLCHETSQACEANSPGIVYYTCRLFHVNHHWTIYMYICILMVTFQLVVVFLHTSVSCVGVSVYCYVSCVFVGVLCVYVSLVCVCWWLWGGEGCMFECRWFTISMLLMGSGRLWCGMTWSYCVGFAINACILPSILHLHRLFVQVVRQMPPVPLHAQCLTTLLNSLHALGWLKSNALPFCLVLSHGVLLPLNAVMTKKAWW